MMKWIPTLAAGIIIAVIIAPQSALVVLKRITGKIKYIEDEINNQTAVVFDKIERTAESIHQQAMS